MPRVARSARDVQCAAWRGVRRSKPFVGLRSARGPSGCVQWGGGGGVRCPPERPVAHGRSWTGPALVAGVDIWRPLANRHLLTANRFVSAAPPNTSVRRKSLVLVLCKSRVGEKKVENAMGTRPTQRKRARGLRKKNKRARDLRFPPNTIGPPPSAEGRPEEWVTPPARHPVRVQPVLGRGRRPCMGNRYRARIYPHVRGIWSLLQITQAQRGWGFRVRQCTAVATAYSCAALLCVFAGSALPTTGGAPTVVPC